MKYIIHIGQSKTGTSSIQSFLAKNRQNLKSEGFLFPDVFYNQMPLNVLEHNALADALAGYMRYPNFTVRDYFEQFQRQAKEYDCHTIILSAESFFGAPQIWRVPDEDAFWKAHELKIKNLSNFIQGADVQIIVYLRPQSYWFESAISHLVYIEGLLGHKVYESDEQLFNFLKPHLDYRRIINIWCSAFSQEKISILPFDKEQFKNKNIIDDFCYQLNLPRERFDGLEKNVNEGLDRLYIWLKNELNKKRKSKAKERVIINILNRLNSNLPQIEKYKISENLQKNIDQIYTESNKKLCQEFEVFTPNVLTTPSRYLAKREVTDEEKKQAMLSYKKDLYSVNSLLLWLRYSAGAFMRERFPRLNAFLKRYLLTNG